MGEVFCCGFYYLMDRKQRAFMELKQRGKGDRGFGLRKRARLEFAWEGKKSVFIAYT